MEYSQDEMRLAQFFVEREGEGILAELREADFIEQGYLDSLDLVTLAMFVEKEFNRKLDLTQPDIFERTRTFKSLMALVLG
ncbi:MAG: acyl carrier protein [Rhodobacteraceae bacterium]|nr:acyl carrier protein [Paracoccaceae bacterium]